MMAGPSFCVSEFSGNRSKYGSRASSMRGGILGTPGVANRWIRVESRVARNDQAIAG